MVTTAPLILDWVTVRPPLADSVEWMHSAIAVLGDGRLVYGAVGGGALIIHDERSDTQRHVRVPIAAAHGIVAVARNGAETLWVADPGPEGGVGQVLELSLDGRILTRVAPPPRAVSGGWRPTAVVPAPDGALWIADGYGQSLIYRLMPGGRVDVLDSVAGLAFDCPHDLVVDTRDAEHTMAVADRGNRRIVFLNLDGSLDRVVADDRLRAPSCLALRGDDLLVTELLGAIISVDRADRVAVRAGAVLDEVRPGFPNQVIDGETVAPVLVEGVLNSPHGIDATDSGLVYVTEWLFGGRVERLRLSE
jgi:hypothetical protein